MFLVIEYSGDMSYTNTFSRGLYSTEEKAALRQLQLIRDNDDTEFDNTDFIVVPMVVDQDTEDFDWPDE